MAQSVRSAIARFSSCSRPLVLTILVAVAVSCTSIYGSIGYFHYEGIAKMRGSLLSAPSTPTRICRMRSTGCEIS
jgi:hypothetical protein